MEYVWFISRINTQTRTVCLAVQSIDDFDDFIEDINNLQFLALKYNCLSTEVLYESDLDRIICECTFSSDSDFVKFCNDFLSENGVKIKKIDTQTTICNKE